MRVVLLVPSPPPPMAVPPLMLRVREGRAAHVVWGRSDAPMNELNLRPTRVAGSDRSVRIAIEAPDDARVLGEIVVQIGADASVQTPRAPAVGVQVTQVVAQ